LNDFSLDTSHIDSYRFGQTEAFFFLFAVSFGPAFIAIDLSTSVTDIQTSLFFVIVAIIVFVFLMNFTAVYMLSEVYRLTKLGSYQEIGYKISKSNPGYIYMISAIKAIYLVVTCGYCLQFVTSYPLSLIVMLTTGMN
jgi:hypothetical protein